MKFTDGQWVYKKNMIHLHPVHVYNYKVTDTSVTLYAPSKYVYKRENTLDQGLITIQITSPMQDVLKVKIYHYLGKIKKGPTFDIQENCCNIEVLQKEQFLDISSNNLTAKICLGENFSIEYSHKGKKLTSASSKGTAHITDITQGKTYIKHQLSLGVSECVYGLGERFTQFIKNGQVVDCWNEDGGTTSEISYKNIPFYITSNNYGVLVNHSEKVSFEVASEQVESVQFSVPGESMEYYIISSDSMKGVLNKYTGLTGRTPVPPAWSYGLWLSTSFTTDYDETTVNSFVDKMANYKIPLSVFHFDCFWMKGFQWCDFQWDEDIFPNPPKMLSNLKKKGMKICVWINPYISQQTDMFIEGMEKDYFIKTIDGSVWQWDKWQAGMAIVDFTNPQACQWYKDKLKILLEMGVDCFKTDFGERIPSEDVAYFDGSDPIKMHNYYSYLYNKTVNDVCIEVKGESVLFARSATVGGQKYPVHWGGDCWGTYESMAESLRGGLSLCLSGFGYWSHDIGGFESTSPPDIYKRWVAFGLLSSHSRLHGSHAYRVPWNYDEESCAVLKYFTNFKNQLMPYIYAQSQKNHMTGIPLMRAMVLEFQNDKICRNIDLQYMLGDNIMVSPVFNEEGIGEFYLPKGNWTNIITNREYNGNSYYTEECDYFNIPTLVRENSIIVFGTDDSKPDYNYTTGIEIAVYHLSEGNSAQAEIYHIDGDLKAVIEITNKANKYILSVQGEISDAKVVFINKNYTGNGNFKINPNTRGTEVIVGTVKDTKIEL